MDNKDKVEQTQTAGAAKGGNTSFGGLTRYDGFCSYDGGGPAEMEVSKDGQYVKFSDVAAIASQSQAAQPTKLTPERIEFLWEQAAYTAAGGRIHTEFARAIKREVAAHIAGTSQAKQPSEPTDISQRLRERAGGGYTAVRVEDGALMLAAAAEIERYYGGMLAWKQTAEKKDRDWNAERMGRVNDRIAERASQATKAQADGEITAKLNAAVDAEYPLPDTPHTSVKMQWVDNRAAMWRGINAARKILAPVAKEAPAVLEGFALFPINPTPEMIEAGNNVSDLYRMGKPELWGQVYRAMLAAAPVASVAKEATLDNVSPGTPTASQVQAEEAKLYRDLTGDAMALGFDGVPAALEAVRKANVLPPMRGTDSQLDPTMSVLTEARVLDLFDAEFGLQDLEVTTEEIMVFALSIEDEVLKQLPARRFRAQGGITNDKGSDIATTTSTVSAPTVQVPEDVALMALDALSLATMICDAVPNQADKLPDGDPLQNLGRLVNYQESTRHHGYALIRDAQALFGRALGRKTNIMHGAGPSSTEGAQKAPEEVRDSLEAEIIARRIGLTPENEGGFHAFEYGDDDMFKAKGYGETPSAAIRALRTSSTDQANADTGSAA